MWEGDKVSAALVFSIFHSWRHPLPNANTISTRVADEYQSKAMESPQPLHVFTDAAKGSRYADKGVAASTYGFSVGIHCSQLLP